MTTRIMLPNFNSIKVRLKPNVETLKGCASLFQFHKGTIKTRTARDLSTCENNFNSIKVRLKQEAQDLKVRFHIFQFHKGTIKTWKSKNITGFYLHFNSVKVRLKPREADRLEGVPAVFQFHKGTIKTDCALGDITKIDISIP